MKFKYDAPTRLVLRHSAGMARFVALLVFAMGVMALLQVRKDPWFIVAAAAFFAGGAWLLWRAPTSRHVFDKKSAQSVLCWTSVFGVRREERIGFDQFEDVRVAEIEAHEHPPMHRVELVLRGGRRVPLTLYWLKDKVAVAMCVEELKRFLALPR